MAVAREGTRVEPTTEDREIVISRAIDGPRELVFEALGVEAGRVALGPVRGEPTQQATHLTYAVRERHLLAS